MVLTGTHDGLLVALSILIAVFASYTALDLAGRVRAARGSARQLWLLTAALAMGGGIWSMHFLAMLAFSISAMPAAYDLGLTVVSFLLPVLAAAVAFVVMVRRGRELPFLLLAGLILGAGIAAMHYVGFGAMLMPAEIDYAPALLAVSIAIAVGAATVALWIAFRATDLAQRVLAAAAMSVAVAGTHYTAIAAAVFAARIDAGPPQWASVLSIDQTRLALLVAASTFLVLFLALVAALFDRSFALLAERETEILRANEARLRELYRASPLPLMTLDADFAVGQVSDDWVELLGYARSEVLGRPLDAFMTAPSARLWTGAHTNELRAGAEIRHAEHAFQRRSGEVVETLLSARVERDGTGAMLRVLGGLIDITERRRAEQALRQAQKMETVGQLTGGIAHDFNNLLMVVIGNLESAERANRTGLLVKAQRNIESAMIGANRAVGLTQRLLAFSRPQPLRPAVIDLNESIAGMTELFRRSLGGSLLIATELGIGIWPVQVDANQLENSLLNLVINARDATQGSGGTVLIRTENVSLDAPRTFVPAGRYVTVSVADRGTGIPSDVIAKVFEPFFTTKGPGQGTGLGLAMVHGFVKQSGGEIVIDSTPDVGTTVTIYLPRASDALAEDAAAGSPAEARESRAASA